MMDKTDLIFIENVLKQYKPIFQDEFNAKQRVMGKLNEEIKKFE